MRSAARGPVLAVYAGYGYPAPACFHILMVQQWQECDCRTPSMEASSNLANRGRAPAGPGGIWARTEIT